MKATDTFRTQPWCHNCAQAVANKWCNLYPSPSTILDELALSGSGRAEGGLCGALVAAQKALPQHAEEITKAFEEKVGGLLCRDIKLMAKTPCPECVNTADILIEEFSKK
ncbi:MAG: C-GCAxxG-C-C family protein [Bacteroidales bacterium]|nr:C-GCAxxG-C-C family protein [Bacteroidales bacterium]